MRKFAVILVVFLVICLSPKSAAAEAFTAPEVPEEAARWMPQDTGDFGTGLLEMLQKLLPDLRSDFLTAVKTGVCVYACVLLISILKGAGEGHSPAELAGAVCISFAVIRTSQSMISLASETVIRISEYTKLLLPVITAASAAQGGVTSATALYVGTTAFTSFTSNVITRVLLPSVYFFLSAAIANCVLGDGIMKQLKEMIKKFSAWFLKTVITVFMTYMSITGAVSGTADKAALKVTKAAISTAVPVIGSSLAEASDALLISIGIAKNAVGIYGIFALLAVFLSPFLRIGMHYLVLKAASALCMFPDSKRLTELVGDFSSAMGLLLGITGCICVLSLIGAVCFMRGMT